jgi:NADH dehydrogenase
MLLNGTVKLIKANIFEREQLTSIFQHCDAVVNLVGILNENSKGGFQRAHVELPGIVIDACKQAKVDRLLHMSALNADANGKFSTYLRTKGEAQDLVLSNSAKQHGINATSFGPSVIFGPDDSFFNRFAGLLKLLPGPFPLACASSRFAPVYIGDVAEAFTEALNNRNTWGKHYDLCGPRVFTLRELVKYTAEQLGLRRPIIELPDTVARMQGHLLGHFPGKPFSYDNYLSLQIDSVCSGDNGLRELGINPTDIDAVVPYYLGQNSERSRYLKLRRLA